MGNVKLGNSEIPESALGHPQCNYDYLVPHHDVAVDFSRTLIHESF